MLSNTEASYIAGLFDGDGCVGIGVNNNKGYNATHYLYITITNTNKLILEWLNKKFGGHATYHKNYKKHQWYVWRLKPTDSAKFLKLVYPYLRIKKERAKLALKFYNTKKRITGKNRVKEVKKREKYRLKISSLNANYKQAKPVSLKEN